MSTQKTYVNCGLRDLEKCLEQQTKHKVKIIKIQEVERNMYFVEYKEK